MNKKLFIMNKKLLMGLGSALILSTPILVATSCGDNGVKVSGYQIIKDQTDTNKITIRINGQNLSTKSEEWQITDSNNSAVYNVWNFDAAKSNSNSVYFSATKNDTKGQTYSFSCNGTKMILNFSTPWPPTAISSTNGLNAFKGYQGTNKNPETNDQNKANISITDLTVNFEFKNVSQDSAQFMKLILPSQLGNVFENYQGYNQGFSIKWSLKDPNNSDFEINNNTLISTKPIDPTTVQNVTLVGSLNMNGWVDTFEIQVNFSIDNPVQKISSAKSEITKNGDLTILLTGSNLPQEVTKYKFTYSGSETNVPTVDSTKLELDTTHNNTNTSVQFIIKKIKDTTPSAPSNYASSTSPTTPPLPIAQTKGLYGKEFSVTLVDTASNPSSRVEGQPVTFTFADYVAPTSIESSKFFENADSYKQKVNSLQQDFLPLTKEDISQEDTSKPFEWTIASHYKSYTYIYLVLPSEEEILASIGGWKGFSENLPSSPQSPQNTYTTVSWKFKDGTTHDKFEELNGGNILYNKDPLTENNPISADLTATITDWLTNKSLSFDIKITFKLGTLENPTIDNNVTPTPTLSDENTNVKVTITGTNLPTDIAKWKIEESNTVSSQPPKEAGDTSNSIWTINTSTASSTSIEFSAKYSDVAGKKYNFSLVGYSTVTTLVTCPAPKFNTNSPVKGQFAHNRYDIEFTLSGTNLPGDINMYKFGKVTVDGSQEVILDDLEKTINFVSGSEVKITFNKYKDNEITDKTVQTKGLYGKEASIWFSNETQSDTNKISFPTYEISGMNKEFLGTISTGSDSNNLTPQTNLEINVGTMSNNNEYQVTITTDSNTAKFIKFELPSNSVVSSGIDAMGRANGSNFLETGFTSWGGFTSSILTSLTWSIQTPPSTGGSVSGDVTKEGNDGTSTGTSGWQLSGNVLTNSNELTTQGSSVVLTATLTDSETEETVSFKVNLTVKLKTSSSTNTGSTGTTL